ncbi:MAG: ribonuclease Z, partial [Halobacteriaceae archaeon]
MTLYVTFLGTSGAVPTVERNTSSIFINRDWDLLLFDIGEGTQRQMMRFGTGFSISHIFITHLHGDHVLGLPGLIQTWEFNDRAQRLEIYTPPGTSHQISELIHVLDTSPSFPITITEVHPGDRAMEFEEYHIKVFETDHRTTAVGYALIESERKGRFDREKAEELGVPVGPKFSKLHEGEAVELADGRVIKPDQVVGPPRPGRKIVYTGDTRANAKTAEIAESADLLIHDATFASEKQTRAHETAHATAAEAAEIAQEAKAKRLALMHISSRYANDPTVLKEEAESVFDG